MRYFTLILSLTILFSGNQCYSEKAEKPSRLRICINREWKFLPGDPVDGPHHPDYDDGAWIRVGLPHSFSMPYFGSDRFYLGYGWYRKKLDIKKEWIEKDLKLEFDGIFQVAEVYLNGMKIGEHRGGYTGFTVNISEVVIPGENCLAIRVNNLWNPEIVPRAGEHVFSGGIYRDVYLTVTNPVHVTWNGTFISTPVVTEEKAVVNIRTEVINRGSKRSTCKIITIITGPGKDEITQVESTGRIDAGTVRVFNQTTRDISKPSLWSPETPDLYRAKSFVYDRKKLVDTYETTFGMRWFEWTPDSGFFLNGKHLYLEGANVHQDHAGWGDAVTQAGVRRDVELMKDAGFNFIRGSHYPHHPFFAQVCDELGMLFLPENSIWGIGGFREDGYWNASAYPPDENDQEVFEKNAAVSLEEMIRINRNSPSIVAWSMCNEPFFTDRRVMEKMKNLVADMVALSRRLDPTRPALTGGAQREGFDTLGDIAGYNGDGAVLYIEPPFPSLVSEYGSCVSDRPGNFNPCPGFIKNQGRPAWRSGHAIWCGFDHGSISGKMGLMGIVDYYRIPKRAWYWYRNYHLDIPPPRWPEEGTPAGLKLYADKTVIHGTDARDDVHLNVKIVDENGNHISNSPEVTLTVLSGPGEFPAGRSITFISTGDNRARIRDGHAAIEFRSYEGGESIIAARSPGLEDAIIKIVTAGEPSFVDGATQIIQNRAAIPVPNHQEYGKPVIQNISAARPVSSNSTETSNISRSNDYDHNSIWEPVFGGDTLWWQMDMENFYRVKNVVLSFAENPGCEIRVEVSEDNTEWITAAKQESLYSADKNLNLKCSVDVYARFLRITFRLSGRDSKMGIREIMVWGEE
jgi:hypothetical protein